MLRKFSGGYYAAISFFILSYIIKTRWCIILNDFGIILDCFCKQMKMPHNEVSKISTNDGNIEQNMPLLLWSTLYVCGTLSNLFSSK
nr:unnamed protein product [Callosobruchus chinensis]